MALTHGILQKRMVHTRNIIFNDKKKYENTRNVENSDSNDSPEDKSKERR